MATDLDGILFRKKQYENNYMKMFKTNPGFIKHLRIFGEMGFVLIHSQIGFKSKISDKEKEALFCRIHNGACR